MNLGLKGKKALITGSTQGLGKAVAQVLVREGATVYINGRDEGRVRSAIEEIQQQHPSAAVKSTVADLGNESGCEELLANLPEVDILINNMGIFEARPFLDISDEEWFRFIEVNVMSGIRLSRHYIQSMLERNDGRIIFVGSGAALLPSLEMPQYSVTKTMQLSVSRNLAELTRGTNVTVNTVLPGLMLTEFVESMMISAYGNEIGLDEAGTRFMKDNGHTSLLQRPIQTAEIAEFIAFLSSKLSSAINGSAMRVDGGGIKNIF
ncbi:SDR family NAD(P)-dependent oxidoreductase [Bacillus subtilis]|uniref:SDR family NAD(P)-dependent oxidoreductase n=1 Tax=Bacillus subtilis TaxID=1423 RepID=UPI0007AFD97B|nr:SDR family oxidoreductase [Bacillus subtilis]MDX7997554.1 SDR family oxidoreductase [Bacillus subtilis]WMW43301.1 SDR family oxidoreductase [Bacillus subtilis]